MQQLIKDIIYDALTERGYDVEFDDGNMYVYDEDTTTGIVVKVEVYA